MGAVLFEIADPTLQRLCFRLLESRLRTKINGGADWWGVL